MVGQFLHEMHRYDGGRMLPLVHAAKITLPQLAVLEYVRDPRTVSEVANHAGLSRPATSFMIDKLVRRGFVKRSEGIVDRRERRVVLGAKGSGLLNRVHAARVARFEATLGALPASTARRLAGTLEEVLAELERVREKRD